MRLNVLMAAAAAVGLLAIANTANAETAVSYYAGANYTYNDIDFGFGSDSSDSWGVEGAFSAPLGDTFGVQGDLSIQQLDAGGDSETLTSGSVHANVSTDNYRIGGVVGLASFDDSTTWGVGFEGYKYLERWTVGGRATWATNDDADVDVVGVDGSAKYFYTDNLSVSGGLGWGQLEGGGVDADLFSASVGGEWRLESSPLSFTAGLGYTTVDDADIDFTSASVGVRYNWDGGSLRDRDRSGAGLPPLFGGLLAIIS